MSDAILVRPIARADYAQAMRLYDQVCEGARAGPMLRVDVEIANGK